ncbi:hypothetical protein OG474_40975 [Kribbella sp. NBC_01505]|uniref:COG1470 family protein n=1 Tax=Kribbella sp. NBC_01505 TaxID=2903580 RepID=UPI00386D700D
MSTTAYLDQTDLAIRPGGTVACLVQVTNHNSVVESYTLTVGGDLAPYSTIEPATLSLYPGTEDSATVLITLPEDTAIAAGEVPLAVVVQSTETGEVVVPEAVVLVEPLDAVTAELTPRTSHGRRRARHRLAIDNRGNRPVDVTFAGKDPEAVIDFKFTPSSLRVAPGTAAFVKVRVHPLERHWRGPAITRQFSLSALAVGRAGTPTRPDQGPLATVDGAMVQDATLPSSLGKTVGALVATAAAVAAAWLFVLKPAIKSTAEEAVSKPVSQIGQQASQAKDAADKAQQAAGEAGKKTVPTVDPSKQKAEDEAQRQRDELEKAQQQALQGTPFDKHISVTANAAQVKTGTLFTVPKGKILRITDLVYESPGDVGIIEVLRDEQILFSLQTQTFRDGFDQHVVSPIIFTEGQKLLIRLRCTTPAPGDSQCRNGAYVGGSLAATPPPVPKPTSTPTPG